MYVDDLTTPKLLQDALDLLERKREALIGLKGTVVIAEKAGEAMSDKYAGDIDIWVNGSIGAPSVQVTVPVESMRQSAHFLSYLSAHGWERLGDGKDCAYSGTKEYTYPKGLTVRFKPPVDGDGFRSGCRRVIDGYDKMPRYKIVCDDAPATEEI